MTPTLTTKKPKRCFEEDGAFYIGSVGDGDRSIRILCFRNAKTRAVGASPRFSREEAWRRSRRAFSVVPCSSRP